ERTWAAGDQVELEFDIPTTTRRFLNDDYGVLVRGPEVLAVDQRDNPTLGIDRVVLERQTSLQSIEPDHTRRRYAGLAWVGSERTLVIFTPYADCGGDGARFRTAFPVSPEAHLQSPEAMDGVRPA